MRILVTGGAGFVGRNLVTHLIGEGHGLTVLEHPSASLGALPENVTVFQPDVAAGWDVLSEIVDASSPDAIIHLAAIVRTKPEREWLGPLLNTNILLGAHLLQAAVDKGVKRFIAAGSYWQSQRTAGEYDPVNIYAATKQAFSDLLLYYGRSGMIETVLLKLFGNYGPKDDRNNLFGALKKAIRAERPVPMTSGTQEIDVIHVDDVCAAFISTVNSTTLEGHCELEVGTGRMTSIRQIADWYSEGARSKLNLAWGQLPNPDHYERSANISETRTSLNWYCRWATDAGIRALGESDASR